MDLLNVLVSGVLLGGIYALVAIGLNLVFGVVRVVNFAHGEFVMLGAYSAYFFHSRASIDPYFAVLLVAPAGFVLGLVVQKLIIERLLDEPLMQIFATFGLVIVFQNAVLALTRGQVKSVRTGASTATIELGEVSIGVARLVILVVATALAAALIVFLRRSTYGTAVRAVSQDRSTARLMGINVRQTYLITFGVATSLACVAGALLAPAYSLTPHIGLDFVLPAFAVVVLGGLGSIAGSYIGGMIVGVVEALGGYYLDPSLKQAVWFTLFLAALVLRPAGLLGQRGAEELAAP
jgi:branched-chain amino acid transport system permease protein